MFIPIIASNLYCDYLTDHCTTRITGVGPGGVYLPAEWGTQDGCYYTDEDGITRPCRIDIAQINWPFPPKIHKPIHECIEICPDESDDENIESEWNTGEDYCREWCDQNELYELGCTELILEHLIKYSNLLDEEFDGIYYLDHIGLPDGVSVEKFEECVDIIFEKRISVELENEN